MIRGSVEVSRVPKLPQDLSQQAELSSVVKLFIKVNSRCSVRSLKKLQSPLSFRSRLMGAA